MKILVIADEESQKIWDFFRKEDYADIDLVISCGDLKADYLSFIATMIAVPVLYVHGNHDDKYERKPPEGCICIEDTVYMFHGIRILGLGGSYRYKPGVNQYTEVQMERRIRRLFWKIRRKGGNTRLYIVAVGTKANALSLILHRISFHQDTGSDQVTALKNRCHAV